MYLIVGSINVQIMSRASTNKQHDGKVVCVRLTGLCACARARVCVGVKYDPMANNDGAGHIFGHINERQGQ